MLMSIQKEQVCDKCGKIVDMTVQSVLNSEKNLCSRCFLEETKDPNYEKAIFGKFNKTA